MEAIRKIQNVTQGEIHLSLPESFWGKEVEIIVLATNSAEPQAAKEKKSLRGALREYAKPERIAGESDAWSGAVRDNNEPD